MNLPSKDQFYELSYYTLAHGDKSFIHQHAVDAQAAQTADRNTKPIALIFALAGLYLLLEKSYSGRQVQLMHMRMAENKKDWPAIALPFQKGKISVTEVLEVAPGLERDKMIHKWCADVWEAYSNSHETIATFLSSYLDKADV